MKHIILKIYFSMVLLVASGLTQATLITDDYFGSDDHGYGDVIGDANLFGIDSLEFTRADNFLTVSITTAFAGRGDDALFSSYTFGGTGVGYGDLFLSTSWDDVDGSAPYMTDDASTGEVWEYGFSLDDRWMSEDDVGTGRLYSLNANDNLVNTLQSEHFMSGAIFRNGQEIEVDKTSNVTAKSTGTWGIDTEEGTVNFSIDLTDTALLTSDNIAFHWGPSCANDIIEGIGSATVVPIPDAIFLFGSGLMGVIGIARRKNTA